MAHSLTSVFDPTVPNEPTLLVLTVFLLDPVLVTPPLPRSLVYPSTNLWAGSDTMMNQSSETHRN